MTQNNISKSGVKLEKRELMSATTLNKLTGALGGSAGSYHQQQMRSNAGQDQHFFWQRAMQTRKDAQVMACMQQRIYHAVALPYHIEAFDDSAEARKIADFVSVNLRRLNMDKITEQMLWSRYYGYSVAEIIWQQQGNHIVIENIKPRHPQYFDFDEAGKLALKNDFGKKTALPEKKFWHVTSGGICADEPRGEALSEWLYAPVKIKNDTMEQWQLFLEKYASPTIVGKYPAARIRESEKNALLEAAANLRRDTAAVIPDSMVLELLEANRTGNGEYHPLVGHCHANIAKLILGQTMTTDEGSSYAQANVHDKVRGQLVQADCDLISESFSRQIIRWLCEWNFGEAVAFPFLKRGHKQLDPAISQKQEKETS